MINTIEQTEQYLWDYYLEQGCSEYGVAGLMGNLFQESGLVSNNLQNTGNKTLNMTDEEYTTAVDDGSYSMISFVNDKMGYGLAQWTFWSLKQDLYTYAKTHKTSIGDLKMQTEFLWQQLSKDYPQIVIELKKAETVLEASNAVLLQFERPADQSLDHQQLRAKYGQGYYDKYAKGKDMSDTPQQYQEMGNGYLYEYQPATNGKYWNLPTIKINGLVLHSIGTPQPSAQSLVNYFNSQSAVASVHGFIEPSRFIETAPTRMGFRLAKKCYHVGGNYNNNRIGIEMTEPNTIRYTGGASWKDLNPEATKKHVTEVVNTAVKVFADLCIYHNLPAAAICSHDEARLNGNGSAHFDPEHLIGPAIGWTMDDFRREVQKLINERNGDYISTMTKTEFETILDNKFKKLGAVTYKYLEDIPAWGITTVNKCIEKGFLGGTGKDKDGKEIFNITNDLLRTLVINDRSGVYDLS